MRAICGGRRTAKTGMRDSDVTIVLVAIADDSPAVAGHKDRVIRNGRPARGAISSRHGTRVNGRIAVWFELTSGA
jgi:hypothetical protein